MGKITVHCLVCNEERFVWFAVNSVLPFAEKVIIFDTGSTDNTIKIIKAIKPIKADQIIFEEKGQPSAPRGLTKLRQEMVKRTATPFFLLVDGDEVWPRKNLEMLLETARNMPGDKIAVVCRTRDAVGDVWHYLPEEEGRYHLAGQKGSLSMRLFRNNSMLEVQGKYPMEGYYYRGRSLNDWDDKLQFADIWYLHLTHLQRSGSREKVFGFRRRKISTGVELTREELPEGFFAPRPSEVPDPLIPRGLRYESAAKVLDWIRRLK